MPLGVALRNAPLGGGPEVEQPTAGSVATKTDKD